MERPAPTRRAGRRARIFAGLFACAAMAVLLIAARIAPDSRGFGTHTQLGLSPCSWVVSFNKPCMTCGMTTAFAHAATGDLAASARTQPMGALLAVMTAAAALGGLHMAATGSRMDRLADELLRPRVVGALVALAGAAWVYKLVTWPG